MSRGDRELFRWRREPFAPPLILGHRGVRGTLPENTMLAFERARQEGADGIELDVRTTADGVVIVAHDRDLARMTAGRDVRLVEAIRASELPSIALEGGGVAPTLAEVLDWADAHRLRVNVELKHDVPDRLRLARAVSRLLSSRARASRRVLVSSFDPLLVAAMASLSPSVPRALLVHARQRYARSRAAGVAARLLSSIAIHMERTLCSPSRVARLRAQGLLVNVWTVNDPREARDLARLGVDALITDDPAGIIAALAER